MLAVWIILGILALVGLLLLLPLRIHLRYSAEQGLQYRLRLLFLTIDESEGQKPSGLLSVRKLLRKPKDPERSTWDTLAALLFFEELGKRAKQTHQENGLADAICLVAGAVRERVSSLFGVIRKCVVTKFSLQISVGDADPGEAAFTYGTICAAVYPLAGLLETLLTFRRKELTILCDYDSAETKAVLDTKFFFRLGSLLAYVVASQRQNETNRKAKEKKQ